jgi:hypothetical protein
MAMQTSLSTDSRELLAVRLLQNPPASDGRQKLADSIARGFHFSDDSCFSSERIGVQCLDDAVGRLGAHDDDDFSFVCDLEGVQPKHLGGVKRLGMDWNSTFIQDNPESALGR